MIIIILMQLLEHRKQCLNVEMKKINLNQQEPKDNVKLYINNY